MPADRLASRGFDDDPRMMGHEAKGVAPPMVAVADLSEDSCDCRWLKQASKTPSPLTIPLPNHVNVIDRARKFYV